LTVKQVWLRAVYANACSTHQKVMPLVGLAAVNLAQDAERASLTAVAWRMHGAGRGGGLLEGEGLKGRRAECSG
jgi:hypothetical protein